MVSGLSHFGVSELKSFMVAMPLLILVLHAFVGWLRPLEIQTASTISDHPYPQLLINRRYTDPDYNS